MPIYYMLSGDDSFRAQIHDLMTAYDVQYDDIFYSFADIYDALTDFNLLALPDLLAQFDEFLAFFPSGTYSHTSPKGVGWSMNIDRNSYQTVVHLSWNDTLHVTEK